MMCGATDHFAMVMGLVWTIVILGAIGIAGRWLWNAMEGGDW